MKRARRYDWHFPERPVAGAPEKQISTRELADFLGVSTRTIHSWKTQGRIPFWKIGKQLVRYELSAVERALSKPNFEE